MSSQMLAAASKEGMAGQDDMKLLEQKARALAEETKRDKGKSMSFVK